MTDRAHGKIGIAFGKHQFNIFPMTLGREKNESGATSPNDSVDTAIADFHAWRRELSDQFGGDTQAIVEDAMRRQEHSGHRLIRRRDVPNKTPQGNGNGPVVDAARSPSSTLTSNRPQTP